MLNQRQKDFLIQELNRFTHYHNIRSGPDTSEQVEELSDFSLKRKRAIVLEAATWFLVFAGALIIVMYFRKKPLVFSAAFTFLTLIAGSFGLLLRAMYALGRNRKLRLIVKLLRMDVDEREE